MKWGLRFSGKSCKKLCFESFFHKRNTPYLGEHNHSGERRSRNQERKQGNEAEPGFWK